MVTRRTRGSPPCLYLVRRAFLQVVRPSQLLFSGESLEIRVCLFVICLSQFVAVVLPPSPSTPPVQALHPKKIWFFNSYRLLHPLQAPLSLAVLSAHGNMGRHCPHGLLPKTSKSVSLYPFHGDEMLLFVYGRSKFHYSHYTSSPVFTQRIELTSNLGSLFFRTGFEHEVLNFGNLLLVLSVSEIGLCYSMEYYQNVCSSAKSLWNLGYGITEESQSFWLPDTSVMSFQHGAYVGFQVSEALIEVIWSCLSSFRILHFMSEHDFNCYLSHKLIGLFGAFADLELLPCQS